MQAYDIIMLLVLVAATVFGAWKGLAWQVASLAAIFASYYVALQFRDPLSAYISAEPPWNVFVAMALLYVGTSFVIWLAFRFVRGFIDALRLKAFDAQIGAIFGFAKGVVLCVIITLFAVTLLGDDLRKTIVDSRSGYYIAVLLDKSSAVMPTELSQVLSPYIHKLDERLPEPRYGQRPATDEWQPGGNVNLVPIKELLNIPDGAPASLDEPWRR